MTTKQIDYCIELAHTLNFSRAAEAMRLFEEQEPGVQITPVFQYENGMESFLKNESDILFALKEDVRQIPGITAHPLFESRIYMIAGTDDPLAGKNLISEEDLYGRTLMVGGGSPPNVINFSF